MFLVIHLVCFHLFQFIVSHFDFYHKVSFVLFVSIYNWFCLFLHDIFASFVLFFFYCPVLFGLIVNLFGYSHFASNVSFLHS